MLRTFFSAGCRLTTVVPQFARPVSRFLQNNKFLPMCNHNTLQFRLLSSVFINQNLQPSVAQVISTPQETQVRSLTKFSMKKGKRKTVKPVLKRFLRLHWGAWIRTIAGRQKRMWKKSAKRRHRVKQHVFCNATQSYLLDTMVTNYWRRPKYYIDDPYEPYHTREEHPTARRKPA